MDARTFRALVRVIDYLHRDERKHFQEMHEDGEDTSEHIFNHIMRIEQAARF